MSDIFVTIIYDDGSGYQQRAYKIPGAIFGAPIGNGLDEDSGNPARHLAWRAGMLADVFREYQVAVFATGDAKEIAKRVPASEVPWDVEDRL